MQGDESLAAGDVVEQGLILFRSDPVDVREEDQSVEAGERFRIQIRGIVGVFDLDAAGVEHGFDLHEPLLRPVVAVVAEEEEFERGGFGGGDGSR